MHDAEYIAELQLLADVAILEVDAEVQITVAMEGIRQLTCVQPDVHVYLHMLLPM